MSAYHGHEQTHALGIPLKRPRTPPQDPPCGWRECSGQAHQPGVDQDHCMVCVPFWGSIPVCPECVYPAIPDTRHDVGTSVRLVTLGKSRTTLKRPFCPLCRRRFSTTSTVDQDNCNGQAWSYMLPRERWGHRLDSQGREVFGMAIEMVVEADTPTSYDGLVLRAEAGCTHVMMGIPGEWTSIAFAMDRLQRDGDHVGLSLQRPAKRRSKP